MEESLLCLHPPEQQGGGCSLTAAGPALQACRVASPGPFWTRSSAAQALAQDWEAHGWPVGSALLLRSAFIFMPRFLSPGQASVPGKHFSPSMNEGSFLLLLSTDDSFLIAFSVGSCKGFFKTCISPSYRTQGFIQHLLCVRQFSSPFHCMHNPLEEFCVRHFFFPFRNYTIFFSGRLFD